MHGWLIFQQPYSFPLGGWTYFSYTGCCIVSQCTCTSIHPYLSYYSEIIQLYLRAKFLLLSDHSSHILWSVHHPQVLPHPSIIRLSTPLCSVHPSTCWYSWSPTILHSLIGLPFHLSIHLLRIYLSKSIGQSINQPTSRSIYPSVCPTFQPPSHSSTKR